MLEGAAHAAPGDLARAEARLGNHAEAVALLVDGLKRERDDLKEQILRIQADNQNILRRIRQQMEIDLQRERLRTLPVAAIEVTPTSGKLSTGATTLQLSARAIGSAGEGLLDRSFTWEITSSPSGVTMDNGLLTRSNATTTGTVSIRVTSGSVSKTVNVELA